MEHWTPFIVASNHPGNLLLVDDGFPVKELVSMAYSAFASIPPVLEVEHHTKHWKDDNFYHYNNLNVMEQ